MTFNLNLPPGLQKEPDQYGHVIYNMWRGLQVVPVPSTKYSWDISEVVETDAEGKVMRRWHTDNPIFHFVLHSLCGGCKERFDYLILWCAISVTYTCTSICPSPWSAKLHRGSARACSRTN